MIQRVSGRQRGKGTEKAQRLRVEDRAASRDTHASSLDQQLQGPEFGEWPWKVKEKEGEHKQKPFTFPGHLLQAQSPKTPKCASIDISVTVQNENNVFNSVTPM